jgi:hypothetical protein
MGRAFRNVVVLAFCCGGCNTQPSWEITITGDVRFDGSYTVVRTEGEKHTVQWENTLPPLSIPERGTEVSVSLRKKSGPGLLTVELLKDGKSVARQSTTRNFGPLEVESR